jgi:hypothetical protein
VGLDRRRAHEVAVAGPVPDELDTESGAKRVVVDPDAHDHRPDPHDHRPVADDRPVPDTRR